MRKSVSLTGVPSLFASAAHPLVEKHSRTTLDASAAARSANNTSAWMTVGSTLVDQHTRAGAASDAFRYPFGMDHFTYIDGELCCQGVRLGDIASEFGTPTYVYSRATLEEHYRRLSTAFAELKPLICFSVKSCPNIHVLRVLVDAGAGLDVVSLGELRRARMTNVPAERIVFAGVGKSEAEVRAALTGEGDATGQSDAIGMFNIESEPEYEAVGLVARALGKPARAALRVNPNVKAGGHDYISTGYDQTKFGVDLLHARTLLRKFNKEKFLPLTGVHIHIGSSILSPAPYVEAITSVLAMIDELAAEGVVIDTLDIGGGFGADYHTGDAPTPDEYARHIVPLLRDRVAKGLRIVIEPGRMIAASAGVLLLRIVYVKHNAQKKFVICDAGMNALIRPALYDAFHFIWPISVSPMHEPVRRTDSPDMPGLEACDIVGPLCETGDFLAHDRTIPIVARGELLAVFTAGAYGMSMASRYNSHPLPAEVLVDGNKPRLIRRRETLDDLLSHELGV